MEFLDVLRKTELLNSNDKTPKNADAIIKKNEAQAVDTLDKLKEDERKLHESYAFVTKLAKNDDKESSPTTLAQETTLKDPSIDDQLAQLMTQVQLL